MVEPPLAPTAPWYPFAPVALEPEGEQAAGRRLRHLPAGVRSRVGPDAVFVGGNSNDAWLGGTTVLRVCWRGDRGRFLREAAVLRSLPAGVPRPDVIDVGRTDDLSWLVTGRGPGVPLHQAGPLDDARCRDIGRQHAASLRELHAWTPPRDVADLLRVVDRHAPGESPCPKEVVPLRVDDVVQIARDIAALPDADAGLVADAIVAVEALRDLDPGATLHDTVVHGDPAWGNLLVAEGRLSALIDFEWVRFGPIDLELVVPTFLGFTSMPARRIVRWLAEDCPELFDGPELRRRMWLHQLSFALRGVLWWPPDAPEPEVTPDHHLHNLRRLSQGPFFDLPDPFGRYA